MILWSLFWGFLVSNLLGYGGGPSTIPLMQHQIVNHYHWMTIQQFANLLAIGNALPGPIATKIAATVGYQVGGVAGSILAVLAAVLPSAVGLILMLKILTSFRKSDVVRGMTTIIQPVITVLMILLTWEIFRDSMKGIGVAQSAFIGLIAFWAIKLKNIHPAFVIVGAFVYGGLFSLLGASMKL